MSWRAAVWTHTQLHVRRGPTPAGPGQRPAAWPGAGTAGLRPPGPCEDGVCRLGPESAVPVMAPSMPPHPAGVPGPDCSSGPHPSCSTPATRTFHGSRSEGGPLGQHRPWAAISHLALFLDHKNICLILGFHSAIHGCSYNRHTLSTPCPQKTPAVY